MSRVYFLDLFLLLSRRSLLGSVKIKLIERQCFVGISYEVCCWFYVVLMCAMQLHNKYQFLSNISPIT
jgi:hypothetical protein